MSLYTKETKTDHHRVTLLWCTLFCQCIILLFWAWWNLRQCKGDAKFHWNRLNNCSRYSTL